MVATLVAVGLVNLQDVTTYHFRIGEKLPEDARLRAPGKGPLPFMRTKNRSLRIRLAPFIPTTATMDEDDEDSSADVLPAPDLGASELRKAISPFFAPYLIEEVDVRHFRFRLDESPVHRAQAMAHARALRDGGIAVAQETRRRGPRRIARREGRPAGLTEVVLRRPHLPQRLRAVRRAKLHAHVLRVHAQERIRPVLLRHRRRHRGLAAAAFLLRCRKRALHVLVFGLHERGEPQVAHGVLVPAIELGFAREVAELLAQRGIHHLGRALEEPPTARHEHRVPGKDSVFHDVRHRAERVTGHVKRPERQARDLERRPLLDPDRLPRNPTLCQITRVSVDGQVAETAPQRLVGAHVVPVVVGVQDGHEVEPLAREGREHGLRVRGIHHDRLAPPFLGHEIRIVVTQTRNGDDTHAATLLRLRSPLNRSRLCHSVDAPSWRRRLDGTLRHHGTPSISRMNSRIVGQGRDGPPLAQGVAMKKNARSALWLFASILPLTAAGYGCSGSTDVRTPQTAEARGTLTQAQSCADLEQMLKADATAKMNAQIDAIIAEIEANGGYWGYPDYGWEGDGPVVGSSGSGDPGGTGGSGGASGGSGSGGAAGGSNGDGSGAPPDHSDTNTQVEGVDEADILKTDGNYLYLLHGQNLEILKSWPVSDLAIDQTTAVEGNPIEMFVTDDKLVIYSQVDGTSLYEAAGVEPRSPYYDYYGGGVAYDGYYNPYYAPLTKITVLGLQGGATTGVEKEVYFEGSYASSRRVGKHVRTILSGGQHGPGVSYYPEFAEGEYPETADESIDAFEDLRFKNALAIYGSTIDTWLPYRFEKSGGNVSLIPPSCSSYYVPTEGSTAYGLVQVQSFALDNLGAPLVETSIVGGVDTVYSSEDGLYLAARGWNDPTFNQSLPLEATDTSRTYVHKFDLATNPAQPAYVATGSVLGHVKNQFSLDEKDGLLRIATTASSPRRRTGPRRTASTSSSRTRTSSCRSAP